MGIAPAAAWRLVGPSLLAMQYYDLPVVSVRAATWRLMHAGIDGFKVGGWVEQPEMHLCLPT